MIKKAFLFIILLFLITGCISQRNIEKVYLVNMANKVMYYGFEIEKPISKEWYLYSSKQYVNQAILQREIISTSHKAFFQTCIDSIDSKNFEKYVYSKVEKFYINDLNRYILEKKNINKIDSLKYQYELRICDKKMLNAENGENYLITEVGYIEKHKFMKNCAIICRYTEMGYNEELNQNYILESKQLFKSMVQEEIKGKFIPAYNMWFRSLGPNWHN